MQAAGIDPDGMLRMFAKLDVRTGGGAPPAWLSSHPTTPERLQLLLERVGAGPTPTVAVRPLVGIDWTAVQASLRE